MSLSTRTTLTVIALATSLTVARAQTPQDHAAHHPGQTSGSPAQTAPQVQPGGPMGKSGQTGSMPVPGMMGGGRQSGGAPAMMGGDMRQMMEMMGRMAEAMGSAGEAGEAPTAEEATHMGQMMQSMAQIMGNMGRMMEEGGTAGAAAAMPSSPAEGRIAILKTELGITDAQEPQWTAFVNALQSGPQTMRATLAEALQNGVPTSAPDRAELRVKLLSTALDAFKATVSAEKSLYAVLSDDQKQVADKLLSGPMGRM